MINFYKTNDPYGEFSNFYKSEMTYKGKTWKTSEHAFQAQKFIGTEWEEAIRNCDKAREAAEMGRRRDLPLSPTWNQDRDQVMYEVVKAKFSQNERLKSILLSTGNEELIEHTVNDSYWADGGDGSGKNMLGIILMRVRDELRNEAA